MYLVDTNVWLELLLAQEKAIEAQAFFENVETSQLVITRFRPNPTRSKDTG
jgi:predicted nucleic acid-binding protein